MTERSERIDKEAEESLNENGALTHHRKELRNGSAKCEYGVIRQWGVTARCTTRFRDAI